MKRLMVGIVIASATLTGCATKYYGREGEVTAYEKSSLSCPEIDIELAKVDQFQRNINQESQFDRRSALSFATDFGIGNSMEKSAATKSAEQRRRQLEDLRAEKGCGNRTSGPSSPPAP